MSKPQDMQKVVRINASINSMFRYEPDYEGLRDFQAAVRDGAKCYDYARHKAASLEFAGVDKERMKFLTGLWNGTAHTVLGIYDEGDDPLVLDNTTDKVQRLSQRQDLSFMAPLQKAPR